MNIHYYILIGGCCDTLLVTFSAFFLPLPTFFKLSIVGFVFALGDASRRTTGGRNQGDYPRHKSWSGLLRHGGQCGGGRGEVHPRGGRLYYR